MSFFGQAFAAISLPPMSSGALLAGTLPLRYCSAKFASRTPFWALPIPGHVAGLVTDRVQAAQVDEVEVARRDIIGLVVLDLVGKEFNKTEKPQHTSWDYLCMLVHVCGRGCIDLGSLVSQVLIAKGSGAIDKVMMAILFIPRLVWVDIGVAQAHVSRSAC